MLQPRPGEQDYAWVPRAEHPERNRYDQSIETVPEGHELRVLCQPYYQVCAGS